MSAQIVCFRALNRQSRYKWPNGTRLIAANAACHQRVRPPSRRGLAIDEAALPFAASLARARGKPERVLSLFGK